MKPLTMVIVASLLGAAGWWWFTQEAPRREQEQARQAQIAHQQAERANSLYKWRDANGVLQITQEPPKGRKYERISRTPRDGIVVDGNRQ